MNHLKGNNVLRTHPTFVQCCNSKQMVVINGCESQLVDINAGVPQGSILMLFVGCEPCGHFTEHTSNYSKLTFLSLLSYLEYPWFST